MGFEPTTSCIRGKRLTARALIYSVMIIKYQVSLVCNSSFRDCSVFSNSFCLIILDISNSYPELTYVIVKIAPLGFEISLIRCFSGASSSDPSGRTQIIGRGIGIWRSVHAPERNAGSRCASKIRARIKIEEH